MSLKVVSDFHVEGIIKDIPPRKGYVIPIHVEWKNGVVIQVYRSYKSIYDLQQNLLKLEDFLTYLKKEYSEGRTGYLLTDKTLFGKLGVKTEKKTLTKLREVDEFLKSIIHLPSAISQSDVVLEFFHPVPDDLMSNYYDTDHDNNAKEMKANRRKTKYALKISEPILLEQYVAICDYKKPQKNILSLKAGNIVEVITMGETGWWFVDLDGDLGWVPASFLTPRDGEDEDHEILKTFPEGEEEICFAMGTYKPSNDDEVALKVGQILQVKQKNIDGWWLVSSEGKTGWVPCMHLHVLESSTGYTRQMERENIMSDMKSKNVFVITDRRTTWNPARPITAAERPNLSKRRPHHDLKPGDGQPSYMNLDFGNKDNSDSDSNYEEIPNYVNCGFDKKTNKRSGKKRENGKNRNEKTDRSYMNMAYHNNRGNGRMRRRKDEDGDLVELDFGKSKQENKETVPKQEAKPNQKQIDVPVEVYVTKADSEETDEKEPKDANEDEKMEGVHAAPLMMKGESLDEDDSDVFLPIGDYSKDSDIEVNLQEGKPVQVLEQNDGGWWLVRTKSLSIGWAPSNFLEKITSKELQRRKDLGLETPELPPVRPPKSNRVHQKGLEICHERKFWSFVRKNGKAAATCSILDDDVKADYFGDGEKPQDGEEPSGKRVECDEKACYIESNTTKL